jgi:septal ring factor EnvC (AmiA/AmiB activator)
MSEITNELMFEVLKSIQGRLETMERSLKDLAHGQIRVREDLNNFHRDAIRLESQVSDVGNRLERLEKRFETVQIN